MKIIKKLMPLLTVASSTAIVCPLITSCGSTWYSTSSFEFTPSAKHATDTISINDDEKLKNLALDYFSNKQNIAQDYLYTKAQTYQQVLDYLKENYEDVSLSFNVSTRNTSCEQKTIKFTKPDESVEKEITAYLVSCEITYSRTYSYTLTKFEEESKRLYKKYKYTQEASETDTIKNAFAFVHYDKTDEGKYIPTIYLWFNDKASDSWEWRDREWYTETCEYTCQDDTVIIDQEQNSSNDYYAAKAGATPFDLWNNYITDDLQGFVNIMQDMQLIWDYGFSYPTPIINTVNSYYLSDITFTA